LLNINGFQSIFTVQWLVNEDKVCLAGCQSTQSTTGGWIKAHSRRNAFLSSQNSWFTIAPHLQNSSWLQTETYLSWGRKLHQITWLQP